MIPRGLVDPSNAFAAAAAGAAQWRERAEYERRVTFDTVSDVARTVVALDEYEQQRRAAALNTDVAVAATRAEQVLKEKARTSVISTEDINAWEQQVRAAIADKKVPGAYAVAFNQSIRKLRAEIEARVSEYNYDFVRAEDERRVIENLDELTRFGAFDAANAAVAEASAAGLVTPLQAMDWRNHIYASAQHAALFDKIDAGDMAGAKAIITAVRADDSVDATLRDSTLSSLEAAFNMATADTLAAAREQQKLEREIYTEGVAALTARARFLEGDERLLLHELDQMLANKQIKLKDYNTLRGHIESRQEKDERETVTTSLMLDAIETNDPSLSALDPHRKKTADRFARDTFESTAEYSSWSQEDKATLLAMSAVGYAPSSVDAALANGMVATDPFTVRNAVQLAMDLKAFAPYAWQALPGNRRAYYARVQQALDTGLSLNDALGRAQAAQKRTPAEKRTIEEAYKVENITPSVNAADLMDRIEDDLDIDSPVIAPQLRAAYDTLVRENYLYTEDIDTARSTAYDTLKTIARPSTFNGYSELAVTPPEWPPGATVPLDKTTLRAQFDQFMQPYGGGAERTVRYTGGVTAKGAPVYGVYDKNGLPVLDDSGEYVLWTPDYGHYATTVQQQALLRVQESRAEMSAAEAEDARILKLLEEGKSPTVTGMGSFAAARRAQFLLNRQRSRASRQP